MQLVIVLENYNWQYVGSKEGVVAVDHMFEGNQSQ